MIDGIQPDAAAPTLEPYYSDDLVTLYHGDCLEHPELWTCADVLVTDPPYGMAYSSNFAIGKRGPKIVGDGDTKSRDAVLAAWGDKPGLVFGTWRCPRPESARQLIVWDKGESPGMGDLSMPWGPSHEEAYVLGTGFVGKRTGSVIRIPGYGSQSSDRPDHPTPKPTTLLAVLLAKCPPGVVADPFTGSGSTLRAAKDAGRKAIGVEIDERYCEIAAKRLGQEVLDFGGAA